MFTSQVKIQNASDNTLVVHNEIILDPKDFPIRTLTFEKLTFFESCFHGNHLYNELKPKELWVKSPEFIGNKHERLYCISKAMPVTFFQQNFGKFDQDTIIRIISDYDSAGRKLT